VIQVMVDAFTRRRETISSGLNSIDGLDCLKPEGAFYVFPRITGIFELPQWKKVAEKFSHQKDRSTQFSSYLLEEVNVAVVPGIAFGNDDHIRMSFATSDENIEKGVERIKEAVEKLR
jgi:aspartate aminotransferase